MAPTLFVSRNALPPEGAARLQPGKAGSAAHAGLKSPSGKLYSIEISAE
jgi:hypothetical protein